MFSSSLANLKFRQVIDSSPVPYILVGRDRKISFINPAFTGLYGYSMHDLPTLALWWNKTNIPKNFLKTINDWWDANLGVKTLPDSSVEVRITCLDGSERLALLSVSPLHDAVNNELLLVVYDITTHKLAEQQIHFSEQIFSQAHEGIVLTDTQSRILQVNPAFSEITGYSVEEALQNTPAMLKSGKHDDAFFQQMWQSWKTIITGKVQSGIVTKKAIYMH